MQWISVDEATPMDSRNVFVADGMKFCAVGYYLNDAWMPSVELIEAFGVISFRNPIKYWANIPK